MLCYNGYAKKIYKYIDGSGLDLRHLRRIAGRLNDKGEIAPLERQTGNMFNRHWYPGSRQETNKYLNFLSQGCVRIKVDENNCRQF